MPFPFERLDGRPLVYASFGTTFGNRSVGFQTVAKACAALPVQLVVSLGGSEPGSEHADFPGKPIVVRYAPQRELLSRATAVITHAGLNTTLEALSLGVPLLALPIAGDQMGVAARVQYHDVGLTLGRSHRTREEMTAAISSLVEGGRYITNARMLQASIAESRGPVDAADIIESAARIG